MVFEYLRRGLEERLWCSVCMSAGWESSVRGLVFVSMRKREISGAFTLELTGCNKLNEISSCHYVKG